MTDKRRIFISSVQKGILQKAAETGRGTHYSLGKKPAINTPNPPPARVAKGSQRAHTPSVRTAKPAKKPTKGPSTARVAGSHAGRTAGTKSAPSKAQEAHVGQKTPTQSPTQSGVSCNLYNPGKNRRGNFVKRSE
jgi:hypothetical protein